MSEKETKQKKVVYTSAARRLASNKLLVVFGYVVFTSMVVLVLLVAFGDKLIK